MSHDIAARTLHRAKRTTGLTDMFAFNNSFDSRLKRLGVVLGVGVACLVSTLVYAAQYPPADEQIRSVLGFILLGSLVLILLSGGLLALAIWGAFLTERVMRLHAEQEIAESVEKTGPVARKILVGNLTDPEFRRGLGDALRQAEQSATPLNPDVIPEKFFSPEIVAVAVESLECEALECAGV